MAVFAFYANLIRSSCEICNTKIVQGIVKRCNIVTLKQRNMKKSTLFNEDGTTAFQTDFIPTAMAFTAMGTDEKGLRYLRQFIPKQNDVVEAIASNKQFTFDNGQKLVRNEN